MNPNEYQKLAMRTECRQDVARMRVVGNAQWGVEQVAVGQILPTRLLHSLVGMSAEVGEMMSLVQKWLWYGRGVEKSQFAEELGDLLWYAAQMCETLEVDLGEIMEANLAKLRVRYPDKFRDVVERDLEAERNALLKEREGVVVDMTGITPALIVSTDAPHGVVPPGAYVVQDGYGFGHVEFPGAEDFGGVEDDRRQETDTDDYREDE